MKKKESKNVKKQEGDEYIDAFLGSICSWCSADLDLDEHIPAYVLAISQPHLNWEKFEGKSIGFPILTQGKPAVAAYVLPKDSRAFKEGASLAFLFCKAKCRDEFLEAYELLGERAEKLQGEILEVFFSIKWEKA